MHISHSAVEEIGEFPWLHTRKLNSLLTCTCSRQLDWNVSWLSNVICSVRRAESLQYLFTQTATIWQSSWRWQLDKFHGEDVAEGEFHIIHWCTLLSQECIIWRAAWDLWSTNRSLNLLSVKKKKTEGTTTVSVNPVHSSFNWLLRFLRALSYCKKMNEQVCIKFYIRPQ